MGTSARRAVTVLAAVAVFMGIAGAAVYYVPGHYVATASVLLSRTGHTVDKAPLPDTLMKSLATVAGGATIEDGVAALMGIDGELGDRLSAKWTAGTQLVTITAVGESSEDAARMAAVGANQFISWLETDGRAAGVLAEKTVPPDHETYPARWLWLTAGALLGLAIGAPLAFRPRGNRRKITSITDLSDAADAPVLGVVGTDIDLAGSNLTALPTAHPLTEATRIIRTNLSYQPGAEDTRLIVVTSARPGEGKSTTSSTLAVSLAQTGASVVVLEGDLRKPQLARYMRVSNEIGVTAVLVGQASIEEAVQPTSIPGLDVLVSGPRPPNPTEILQTDVMADLMLDLRDRYDYVIVDAAPILPVADAALLAAIADGVVLVVRHDFNGIDQVTAAVERLHAVDAEVLGTVLTMSPRRATQRYGYGYGYGESGRRRRPGGGGRHADDR